MNTSPGVSIPNFSRSGFGIVACPFWETRTTSGSRVLLDITSCTYTAEVLLTTGEATRCGDSLNDCPEVCPSIRVAWHSQPYVMPLIYALYVSADLLIC